MPDLILASASPRRRELLSLTGLTFTIDARSSAGAKHSLSLHGIPGKSFWLLIPWSPCTTFRSENRKMRKMRAACFVLYLGSGIRYIPGFVPFHAMVRFSPDWTHRMSISWK